MPNPTVQFDMLEGMSGDFHIIRGALITRTAIVTGLASDGAGNYDAGGLVTGQAYQRAMNAIRTVAPPASACPGVTDPHYLESYGVPEFASPDMARVRITYRGFPALQIEFNTSLSQVENNVDNQGNPIIASYTYPSNYGLPSSYLPGGNHSRANGTIRQNAMVPRPVPEVNFTVRFTSSGLAATTAMCSLVGSVNQNPYAVGTISGAPRTWMCTAVTSRSEDGGITYNLALSFQYRVSTWDVTVSIRNPDDGMLPPDVVTGTGTLVVRMAPETTFPVLI